MPDDFDAHQPVYSRTPSPQHSLRRIDTDVSADSGWDESRSSSPSNRQHLDSLRSGHEHDLRSSVVRRDSQSNNWLQSSTSSASNWRQSEIDSPVLSGRKPPKNWPSMNGTREPSLGLSQASSTSSPTTRHQEAGRISRAASSTTKEKHSKRDDSPRRRWRQKVEGPPNVLQRALRTVAAFLDPRSDFHGTTKASSTGYNNARLLRLIALLGMLAIAGLFLQGRLFARPKKVVPLRDIYRANAARREAQLRFTNPSTISYSGLFELNSTMETGDAADMTVTVLFLASHDTQDSDLATIADQFNRQSQTPVSLNLAPSSPQRLVDDDIQFGLPIPDDSHYTLVVPLQPGKSLDFGQKTLKYLTQVASTREFAGSILEIGCAQAVFVQTTWLSSLNLDLDESGTVQWRHRGLSRIRLPLVGRESAIDDFWVDGLRPVSQCAHQQQASLQRTQGDAEKINFLVEELAAFESDWKELICEFASRPLEWSPEIFVLGRSSRPVELDCDSTLTVKAQIVELENLPSHISPGEAHIYALDTSIARQFTSSKPKSEAVLIGLPQDDIRLATWMVSLPLEALKSMLFAVHSAGCTKYTDWHKPQIDITVITNNRPTSLGRLLKSLQTAHYYGDAVHLSVNAEQTADSTTQSMLQDFDWTFGRFSLRHRIVLGGLMPAIVESWYPTGNDTYGVFLEDDIEVSPLFFAWLKFAILNYRYTRNGKQSSQRLFGISLYSPKNVELRPEGRQPFDARNLFHELNLPVNTPYLSQVPCSWGAAYFPEIWREYHQYLGLRLGETSLELSETIVPDVRSNKWPRSWKKYFIELVYARGYTMLYPNYESFVSFSNNHLEMGTHIHVAAVDLKKKMQFEVPLMSEEQCPMLLDLPNAVFPEWDNLPVIDLWGGVATEEEIIARGQATMSALALCGSASAQQYDVSRAPTYDPLELLCPTEYTPTLNLDAGALLMPTAANDRRRSLKIGKD